MVAAQVIEIMTRGAESACLNLRYPEKQERFDLIRKTQQMLPYLSFG